MSFQMDTRYMDARSMLFHELNTHHRPPPSPQHLYSLRSPSFSPPASLPSRQLSVELCSEDSSPKGRKRHQSEPAFIRPHDIDRRLTPRLSALLQKNHPWHHTNWIDQSKQEPDRLSALCIELLSRPLTKNGNWCILTYFKTLTHTAKVDSFHDHHSGLHSKSSEIDSFQDPCK